MKKILFFIPNLMHGGAEKVLVNLVNNLDRLKYDITVQTIFDVGVNKQYLNKEINYKYIFKRLFRGSTTLFKLFSPTFLYKYLIKDEYDIVISYLEGPTVRILSGCPYEQTKKVSWIHIEMNEDRDFYCGFRNFKEAQSCYNSFDKIVCVSQAVKEIFLETSKLDKQNIEVLYNVNETDLILEKSKEDLDDVVFDKNVVNICSVGKIVGTKGYMRLAKVAKKILSDGFNVHFYILGVGEDKDKIEQYLIKNNIENKFTFLGFKQNPYKYISRCDLYICSSFREGFSTAVTESLIVGTPVISTLCSGAKELLGFYNEYGIVTENSELGIYNSLKFLLYDKNRLLYYKEKANERGTHFTKDKIIKETENFLDKL